MKKERYDLTDPQKSIWLTEMFYKGTAVNNISGTLFIEDVVDFNVLKQAILTFVNENSSMRLKFYIENNEPKQYLDNCNGIDFDFFNFENLDQLRNLEFSTANTPIFALNSFLFDFNLFELPNGFGGAVIVIHHLIGDAWTTGLLVDKIMNIYSCLKLDNYYSGDLDCSYLDYIYSEKEYFSSSRFTRDKEYWESSFSSVPEVASLPSFSKESENSSLSNAKRKEFIIDNNMYELINDLCKQNKISVFNFFMAIYSIYIGRVSSLDKFIFGTPILNRSTFKEKNTTGMYISTMPFKVTIDNSLNFIDFVSNMSSQTLSMLKHQKFSYQKVLEFVRKNDSSYGNLYDILISYQNMRNNSKHSRIPYTVTWVPPEYIADSFDIHLFDINDTGVLTIAYDYKTALYSDDDIDNMHLRILHIIDTVLNNSNISLSDIEIITPAEKNIILKNFNNSNVDYPLYDSVFQMIERKAISNPDKIALEFLGKKISYKELIERVNKLVNYLLNNHIISGKSSNIGVFTNRSIDTIVAILAIMKANCTYVPIDPKYPVDRINYMLEKSQIHSVFTDDLTIISSLKNKNLNLIDISFYKYSNCSSVINKSFNYNKDNNLYIIFTSGSTGNPKGVTISHKNFINLIHHEIYSTTMFTKYNRILQFATMSFDVSYQEIFSALITGGTLVLIEDSVRKDSNKLAAYIIDNNINILFIPPAYLRLLTEDISHVEQFCSTLFSVITAGESLIITPGIEKLIDAGVHLHNHYGPAETHAATTYTIDPNNYVTEPPIGYPLSNSYIYVLDSTGNLCPANCVGEIAISGTCVGNGYWNDENLTKDKFVKDKFLGDTMYLTGDLGYFDSAGAVWYVGRSDFQVKLNGFRVELSEIDNVIVKFPNISSSISVIQENNSKKYIVSYYTIAENIDEKELLDFIKSKLPTFMYPTKIVLLDEFPLNNNGKVDKKRLPKVDFFDVADEYIAPITDTEIKLQKIWNKLFNTSNISTNLDFFSMGGDSLLAIKLSAILLSEFDVDISVSDIFDNSNIVSLSNLIDSKAINSNNRIASITTQDFYPVSSAQKRIYLASNVAGNDFTLYNIAGGYLLNKQPDIEKLNACFQTLINRHESFRTCFEVIDGNIMQKVLPNVDFNLDVISASADKLDDIYKNYIKPFDLSKAPLLRTQLVNLDDGSALLLVDMHHIISDGSSIAIIIEELSKLYKGISLDPLETTYKDFTAWEQKRLKSGKFKESKNYWINMFSDEIPVLNLPTSYPRPNVQSFNGKIISSKINRETTSKIIDLCKTLDITPYMFFLSIFYILLSKYSGQNDIIVGSPVVGRDIYELRNVVGMFVNNLVLRNKIDISISFAAFVNEVKKNCISAYEHQAYPFDELIKNLNLKRDTSRNSLFDVMFAYQNTVMPKFDLDGIHGKSYNLENNISKFDLTLEIVPNNSILTVNLEYCTDLFSYEFINNFSSHFYNILNSVLTNHNIIISDISILNEDEKNKILYNFNNSHLEYDHTKNLVDLFKEIVNLHPNDIAVSIGDSYISYDELDKKSDVLANILIDKGIKKQDVIGVCLNRSLELIISIWAILKVGAIYMPMYIGYPKDRLHYILSNSEAKLIITNDFMNSLIKPSISSLILNNYSQLDNNKTFKYNSYSISNVAYVIYTSGSTGNPKGVQITHKCLINYINSFNNYYNNSIGVEDSFLASTNISFDVSIWELFMPILNGARLVLYTEEIINNIVDYCACIIDNNITGIYIPPNILNEVYSLLENHSEVKIHKMLVGVEPIKKETLNKYFNLNKDLILVNGYGPTETTICSTALLYKKDVSNGIVPIGHPLGNTNCYIVDKNMNPQPIGVIGELYITGDGVGKGYINNDEENNKNYLKNIFDNTSSKMYKTGDLVKWNFDGTISYVGRFDNQVKISGYRIELKEIDSVIMKYPNITSALSIVYTANGKNILVSYVTAEQNINISDLITFLQSKLAFYMVPKSITQIDNIPLTPNGKIDFKGLPKPVIRTSNSYSAPETVLQEQLCFVFKELFNTEKVGIDDNFFDLGGDSLIAIKLQAELLNLGLNISYNDIFSYPTIRELSELNNIVKKSVSLDTYKNYDFTRIHNLMSKNCIENISKNYGTKDLVGNVLLIGATGFLGAHILDSLLSNTSVKVYCLIRRKSLTEPTARLRKLLNFYFDNKYDNYFNDRIVVVSGDITDSNLNLSVKDYNDLSDNVSTVINSAALVKHFGNLETFNDVNVVGLKNIINFCRKNHKKLYHISTTSVSGIGNLSNDPKFEDKIHFSEKHLFINQNLDNVYIYTKFKAEQLVYEEMLNGLSACVLRIGNITNRYSDGKFQINVSENAFVNKLKALLELGKIQDKFLGHFLEFTPVDSCANAIVTVIKDNPNFTTLHLFNNHFILSNLLFDLINNNGFSLKACNNEEFAAVVNKFLSNKALKTKIPGIITDLDNKKLLNLFSPVFVDYNFSINYLKSLDFEWPIIDNIYIKKYLDYFKEIKLLG